MATQEKLAAKILDYLNGQSNLSQLVAWAEDAVVTFTESNTRPDNADEIWRILLYIGAGDTPDFPLTWEVIKEFLERLNRPILNVVA